MLTAADYAATRVASVREDPAARLGLLGSLYEAPAGRPELHLPYRRAALAFMAWQVRRGVLNPVDGEAPGSPWWRVVNERLLHDTAESRAHVLGHGGPLSSSSVALSVAFARRPSARASGRRAASSLQRGCSGPAPGSSTSRLIAPRRRRSRTPSRTGSCCSLIGPDDKHDHGHDEDDD